MEEKITRGRRSGRETSVTQPYNSDWEAITVKLAKVSSYQIIKELKCQVEAFV